MSTLLGYSLYVYYKIHSSAECTARSEPSLVSRVFANYRFRMAHGCTTVIKQTKTIQIKVTK